MKQLIVLIGPNAVGKSTTARKYVELHSKTAYIDSDWCRVMNPFSFTDATKQTVSENIYCLIHNYLNCKDINTVIFTYSWHGARKEIYDNVIEKLRNNDIEFDEKIIILKCSENENIKRAHMDARDEARIKRGMDHTFSFYDIYDYPCIDTTNFTPEQVVTEINNLLKEV